VGGFRFGLDIGVHNFEFWIRIGYGVYEKISDPNRFQNFHIRTLLVRANTTAHLRLQYVHNFQHGHSLAVQAD